MRRLPKKTPLHFSGCGLGELVNETSNMGFHNISCSDISEEAIRTVREKYPHLSSFVIPTQLLDLTNWKNKTVFDLHNLHQIKGEDLQDYINAICSISNRVFISWIYEQNQKNVISSDVDGLGNIYYHNPYKVKQLFKDKFKVVEEFFYNYENNTLFFENKNVRTNRVYGLYLEVKK